MGAERGSDFADAFAADELDEIEPVDAIVHEAKAGPTVLGVKCRTYFGIEHIVRKIEAGHPPQGAEVTSDAPAQFANERITATATSNRSGALGFAGDVDGS